MRMWMCPTHLLCGLHLRAEHYELHLHRHNFIKHHSIEGRRGQIEPAAMQVRHDELVTEMLARGYRHASPYEQPDLSGYDLTNHVVDRAAAYADLLGRCGECRKRSKP